MYSPPTSQKKQAIKQAIIYLFMTLTVISIVFVLILITLGYRFNRAEGTIEQGGLVQLNSIPSGASITFNSARLGATTSTRTTISPGEHLVTMSRNGYRTWQKTVDVRRGSVLWLNYARLIPNDLSVQNVADLPAVTSSLGSPNRRFFAMTTEPDRAVITLVNINSDTPELSTLRLPASVYTEPESDAPNESFRVVEWDSSSRYLLVEHRYDRQTEWIVVDTEDVEESSNITAILDAPMTNVQFSSDSGRVLYAIINGDVRKIDARAATISAPLLRGVAEFSLFDRSIIAYTTAFDQATKTRSVGYFHEGARESRTLRTFETSASAPVHVAIDKYYNHTYVAIAHGNTVDIVEGSLPKSDSDDELSFKEVASMTVTGTIDYLSSRTDGRFFIAQHGKSYSVHDLELEKTTTTNLEGDAAPQSKLRWLDGYSIWASLGNTVRLYEFDGANQHDIMPIVTGQNPTLTPNGRYIYAPTKGDDGKYRLSRVRLILQ